MNVYAKFMECGDPEKWVMVVAPSAHALQVFSYLERNHHPNSRTVRVHASSYEVREWKRRQARMKAFSEMAVDSTIYADQSGVRDNSRRLWAECGVDFRDAGFTGRAELENSGGRGGE